MEVQTVQLTNINGLSILSRLDRIEQGIEKLTKPAEKQTPSPELLTRKEVAEMFSVSQVTIWDWTKKNLLRAHKIANRVYYKRPEIMAAMVQISGTKEK